MRYLSTRRNWTGILLALLLTTLPSCTLFKSKEDYRVATLQGELYRVAKSYDNTQKTIEDICGRLHALETKVVGLENNVEELVVVVQEELPQMTESSQTTQKTIEETRSRLHRLETKVDGLHNSIGQLASHFEVEGATVRTEAQVAPESASEKATPSAEAKKAASGDDAIQREYEKAYAAYVERRHDEALTLFKDFLQRYPQHELADNAHYWLGEIYYDMGNYASAILTFKDVVTRFTEDEKAPDALLKIAYSYIALDDPSNARMFLKRVIKNYPFSPAEAKARAKLTELENR